MSFFFQTLSEILKAFFLIVKGDENASNHVQVSDAHWLLSWLMVIIGSFVYLIYLPSAFTTELTQEHLPKDVAYADFKSANMISLIFVLLAGYLIVHLLANLLECTGSVRRYIVSQNWVFLVSIMLLLPLSTSISVDDSPFVSILLFIFIFILFFAYRTLKIILGINGPKAFMMLLVLLVFELFADELIDGWFGLTLMAS